MYSDIFTNASMALHKPSSAAQHTVFHTVPAVNESNFLMFCDSLCQLLLYESHGCELAGIGFLIVLHYLRGCGLTRLRPNAYVIQRMMLGAFLVAMKVYNDYSYSTANFSPLIGLPAKDLCKLEWAVLELLKFDVIPWVESLAQTAVYVLNHRPCSVPPPLQSRLQPLQPLQPHETLQIVRKVVDDMITVLEQYP